MNHLNNFILKTLIVSVLVIFSSQSWGNSKSTLDYDSWGNRPIEEFKNGKESFEKVRQMLLKSYYEKGLTEEDIYRAAVKGMVENLDPKMADWNQFMSPTELKEMQNDVKGEIVGAGIEIKFDSESGMADVIYVIPGSPAQNAGVKVSDRLLSVNGKFYKGSDLRDVVYDIRGKVGQTRRLTLLRQDKVISKTIELKRIPYANVTSEILGGNVGLLTINYFTGNTTQKVREALRGYSEKKIKGLVIDLRGNEGGLFDAATECAGFLVPKGKTIVRVARRNVKEEVIASKDEPLLTGIPVAVLINELTSSGAEIFSAALRENIGAILIGTHTHGKWSVQTVEELPNQYAVKFTVGLMSSPKGNSYAGKGLLPDFEVGVAPSNVRKFQRITNEEKRIAEDSQLRTAVGILRVKN